MTADLTLSLWHYRSFTNFSVTFYRNVSGQPTFDRSLNWVVFVYWFVKSQCKQRIELDYPEHLEDNLDKFTCELIFPSATNSPTKRRLVKVSSFLWYRYHKNISDAIWLWNVCTKMCLSLIHMIESLKNMLDIISEMWTWWWEKVPICLFTTMFINHSKLIIECLLSVISAFL